MAYAEFWDRYIQYGGRTGPFDEADARSFLGLRSTGTQLQKLIESFAQLRRDGLILRGRPESSPTLGVTMHGDSEATVTDCMADSGGVYRAATGERVDSPSTGRQLSIARLVREGELWKVAELGGNQACSV